MSRLLQDRNRLAMERAVSASASTLADRWWREHGRWFYAQCAERGLTGDDLATCRTRVGQVVSKEAHRHARAVYLGRAAMPFIVPGAALDECFQP